MNCLASPGPVHKRAPNVSEWVLTYAEKPLADTSSATA